MLSEYAPVSVSLANVTSGYVPAASTVPASGVRLITAPPAFTCAFCSTTTLSVLVAPVSRLIAELTPTAPPRMSVTVAAPLLLPVTVSVLIAPSTRSSDPPPTFTMPPVALVELPNAPGPATEPPGFTVIVVPVTEPVISSLPALTVVAPV